MRPHSFKSLSCVNFPDKDFLAYPDKKVRFIQTEIRSYRDIWLRVVQLHK